jgi:hypothetical protein
MKFTRMASAASGAKGVNQPFYGAFEFSRLKPQIEPGSLVHRGTVGPGLFLLLKSR